MNYPCHPRNPWLKKVSVRKSSSWQFHRLFQRELKLIRERPFHVVRDGVGFDGALRRFWVDDEKRRLRQIAQVIDDDFLLLGIIEIKAAHHNAIDNLAGRRPALRWRSSNSGRWCRR